MLFNEFALCHYLLENGLLNRQQVVEKRVRIFRQFSRNRNFKVLPDDNTGYLVKQPKLPFYTSKSDLKREADIYWLAHHDDDFSSIRNFIPRFYHYDVHIQTLITGLIQPATSLHDYHVMTGEYPEEIACRQAEILGTLHSIRLSDIENKKSFSLFSKKPNWLFNIENEEGWWIGKKTDAGRELQDLIKSNVDFLQCIRSAKQKWKTECLIHNDIRWANFLMALNEDASYAIHLIDWELADFGDPCWDIAGIFQAYFSYWILQNEANPMQLLKMKPAISAFSNAYSDFMKLPGNKMQDMLNMSMEYTGVRMVQSSIEHVLYHNKLERKTVQLLQFAFNILKNPEQACSDFIMSGIKKNMF